MVSQGLIDNLKKLSRETSGKEYTDEEAREGAERLVGFFQLLIKVDKRNKQRKDDCTKSEKNFR